MLKTSLCKLDKHNSDQPKSDEYKSNQPSLIPHSTSQKETSPFKASSTLCPTNDSSKTGSTKTVTPPKIQKLQLKSENLVEQPKSELSLISTDISETDSSLNVPPSDLKEETPPLVPSESLKTVPTPTSDYFELLKKPKDNKEEIERNGY